VIKNIKIVEKIPFKDISGYEDLTDTLQKRGINYLIRYSGTENLMRILIEGKDKKELNIIMKKSIDFFKKALI